MIFELKDGRSVHPAVLGTADMEEQEAAGLQVKGWVLQGAEYVLVTFSLREVINIKGSYQFAPPK